MLAVIQQQVQKYISHNKAGIFVDEKKKSQIIKNKSTKFSFYVMVNAKRIESLSK